jgi:ABC-type transport system involved in cytochrome bd biosynthesis fused ATPase/permease subunit
MLFMQGQVEVAHALDTLYKPLIFLIRIHTSYNKASCIVLMCRLLIKLKRWLAGWLVRNEQSENLACNIVKSN